MKIAVVGMGYVGLVTGTCFADTGNDVVGVDIDKGRIAGLSKGKIPIYEPGLTEMVQRNMEQGRLRFTTDLTEAVRNSLIILIAVGTPTDADGSADLSYVMEAVRSVARVMNGYKIIVTKSTVPVGTADKVAREVASLTRLQFDIVSNPEFLKEGTAVDDFLKPDRVIIGTDEVRAAEIMKELYGPFTRTGAPIVVMDCRSAEMTKYAANAMLASRISFMNEVANLCELVGADAHYVRQGMGLDMRIGPSFLFPGIGYGGSCFPKDIKALIELGRQNNYPLKMVSAIEEVNQAQKQLIVDKVTKFFSSNLPAELEKLKAAQGAGSSLSINGNGVPRGDHAALGADGYQGHSVRSGKREGLAFPHIRLSDLKTESLNGNGLKGRTFAIWGLAFKPQTDDMREAPSQTVIRRLLDLNSNVQAYDPAALKKARQIFGKSIKYAKTNYEALENADALIILTEWNAFRTPDFVQMKKLLKYPVIFDGRNQYNPQEMRDLGFLYFGIGR